LKMVALRELFLKAVVHDHGVDGTGRRYVDPRGECSVIAAGEERVGKSEISELYRCVLGLGCEVVGGDEVGSAAIGQQGESCPVEIYAT
jgi:hypothetical protein